jgi:type I restriction enzyme S subunit
MIEGLNPYEDYKESGLPWAPRVPTHWNLIPNRAVLRKRKVLVGGNHKSYQLLSLTKGGVIVRDISTGKGKFSSDMGTSQEVRKGDFVFCLFDVPETPRTIGLSMHDGMITGAYTVFESPKLSMDGVRYLERFYLAMDDQKLLSPLYSGLRNTITSPRLLGTKTPQPPAEEQAAIVRFIDYANRKIDGFIRAKRKLIGLLNEQKQAIIHRAVTCGLDPAPPLKPSGIPWLGDIPKHWEVKRIKYLLQEVDNRSTTGLEPLLSMRMHHGLVVFSEHFTRPPQAATLVGFKIVRPRQFVVNRMQAGNGVIFPSCLSITGLVSPDYAVFDPIADVNVDYLGELFRSRTLRVKFRSESKGLGTGTSGFMRLYNDRFGAIHIPLPPREEQDSILKGIGEQAADLNIAIARTEREIALMQEYRTRLTFDIVTGKLDVREAAKKLPHLPTDSDAEALIDDAFDDTESEDTEV